MDLITLLRSFRVGPFAIFDFAISYLIVYLLSPYLYRMGVKLSRKQFLWLTLPFSILVHILFGSMTPLTKMFLNPHGDYWVKILVIFMIFMAIWGKVVKGTRPF